jgi:hypothetical protein
MDIDQDEKGLTEHDRALARQIAKENWRLLNYMVGQSVVQKIFWSIIMAGMGFGAHWLVKK